MDLKYLFRAIVLTLVCTVCSAVEINEMTQDNFQDKIKETKTLFLYATSDDCVVCKLIYRHFVIAAHNFRQDPDIRFGFVSDKTLLDAFGVTDVPAIVFYEFGSAIPKVYRGDITATALTKIIAEGTKVDFKSLDKGHTLALSRANFDQFLGNPDQYRLIMLHEMDDEDEVDTFDELAETFENELDVVIARINVDLEKRLRREFQAVDFPSFYWYPRGTVDKKKRYGGEFDLHQMINFINKEVGLSRTKGGKLNPYGGLIKELDAVLDQHGKQVYEIKNYDEIKAKLRAAIAILPENVDRELAEFYVFLLEEVWEDKTIESLDETRRRLYRQLSDVGPLGFDKLIRKRNIVQKYIDVIGNHLLKEMAGGDFGMPNEHDFREGNTKPVKFIDEF